MFPVDIWLAYTAACLLLVISPGPDNLLAIGRGLLGSEDHRRRLPAVAGNQGPAFAQTSPRRPGNRCGRL